MPAPDTSPILGKGECFSSPLFSGTMRAQSALEIIPESGCQFGLTILIFT